MAADNEDVVALLECDLRSRHRVGDQAVERLRVGLEAARLANAPVLNLEVDPLTYWIVVDTSTNGVAVTVRASGEPFRVDKPEAKAAILRVLDAALADAGV